MLNINTILNEVYIHIRYEKLYDLAEYKVKRKDRCYGIYMKKMV